MRSESSRRKFMATAVTATTLLLVFGLRLVGPCRIADFGEGR